jgi:hypothetical protein
MAGCEASVLEDGVYELMCSSVSSSLRSLQSEKARPANMTMGVPGNALAAAQGLELEEEEEEGRDGLPTAEEVAMIPADDDSFPLAVSVQALQESGEDAGWLF